MWKRIRRELLIEYYWWKRHTAKKYPLDSPLGLMGILFMMSGFFLMIIIGQAFAAIFRNMIPVVNGSQVAGVYWSSLFFALKISVVFMVFVISLIFILYFKFFGRKR
ncbi:MAG: hypothetical protein GX434_03030 [Peptococcaceae bacterium]|nr:hypothetical protein [Peptococcaceae bacterium]